MSKSIVREDFCVIDNNFCNYSIDMIRLKCKMTNEFFMRAIHNKLKYESNCNIWESTKMSDFKYNYNIDIDIDCSYWFGFISNREMYCGDGGVSNPKKKFNFTIEFNPNKIIDNRLLNYILSLRYDEVLQCPLDWEIISCDFALDIKTNILNICGLDKKRKKCLLTYDNGGEDKTYYIGKGQNRIKIYNKKIESNLDYDLTRIELSHQFKDLKVKYFNKHICTDKMQSCFPELYLKDYQIELKDLELDSTFKIILFAINNGYPLNELTPYYRRKVKSYLNEKKPIVIDLGCFDKAFYLVITNYFIDIVN